MLVPLELVFPLELEPVAPLEVEAPLELKDPLELVDPLELDVPLELPLPLSELLALASTPPSGELLVPGLPHSTSTPRSQVAVRKTRRDCARAREETNRVMSNRKAFKATPATAWPQAMTKPPPKKVTSAAGRTAVVTA